MGLFDFLSGGALSRGESFQRDMASQAGMYGSQGSAAFGAAFPEYQRLAQAPPGFGALGLASMRTQALEGSAAQASAARERARLMAARTGNMAALPGLESALTLQASRGGAEAITDINVRNEMLKQQQQREGLAGLSGIYGEAGKLGLGYRGLQQDALSEEMKMRQGLWGNIVGGIGGAAGVIGAFK